MKTETATPAYIIAVYCTSTLRPWQNLADLQLGHTRPLCAMNNAQFRRLLIDTPKQQDGAENKSPPSRTPGAVLGARKQSAILMTPYVRPRLSATPVHLANARIAVR